MKLLLRQAVADLRHRRLQTAVILVVALLTTGAATMALNLLLETDAPFDHAFAAANGPHLVVSYEGAVVSESQLVATRHAPGVTAASGPWAELGVVLGPTGGPTAGAAGSSRNRPQPPAGVPVVVLGRDRPDTSVDRLTLQSGRWASAPGEIVVSRALILHIGVGLGDHLVAARAPGQPQLTVVGVAAGVVSEPGAWVRPQDLPSLAEPGAELRYGVAYRVTPAATAADISRALRSITAGLPPGAVADTRSYLDVKRSADLVSSVMVPFLVAFSVFALVATALIVANVVTGVVIASYRDIGIMKSIGFVPWRVSAVLGLEVLVPAVAGALAGVAAGTLASEPFLNRTSEALDLPAPFTAHVPIGAAVLAGMVLLVLLAALAPAWRAARLSAVAAIAHGTSPGRVRSSRLGTALTRLPLPAAARLGLGDMAARPLRAGMTLGAITVGVATVVFALGLRLSLLEVAHHLIRDHYVQVQAQVASRGSGGEAEGLIAARPETARYVAEGQADVFAGGLARPVPYFGYRGDASWVGYSMIHGRWFSGPGEVVAPTQFLRQTGLHVGDTFTARMRHSGNTVQLRLVGEILDQHEDDLLLRGAWATLAAAEPQAQIDSFEIQLRPGTSSDAYAEQLTQAGGGVLIAESTRGSDTDVSFVLLQTVIGGMAVVLVTIAVAGVFNTVVLNTRERFRDLAVLKAVGMGPHQVVAMVVASVIGLGLAAGLIGIPLGLALHARVLDLMAQIASGTGVPPDVYDVIARWQLPALGLAGVGVAAVGAWLPARWAARGPVAEVLQAE